MRGRPQKESNLGVQLFCMFPPLLLPPPPPRSLLFQLLVFPSASTLHPPHYQPCVLLPAKEACKRSSANASDDKDAAQWASLGKAGLAGIDWVMSGEGRSLFSLRPE